MASSRKRIFCTSARAQRARSTDGAAAVVYPDRYQFDGHAYLPPYPPASSLPTLGQQHETLLKAACSSINQQLEQLRSFLGS